MEGAHHLIERYVHDVTRRLPEAERAEVAKELKANIQDMLPEQPDEAAVRCVLIELGAPSALAEQYRQKPRYLISPAYYDEYIRTLKWVLPLVGVVAMAIGMLIAGFDAMENAGGAPFSEIAGILAAGVQMGVSGALQAFLWTTVGFVIAERTGAKTMKDGMPAWSVDELPEIGLDEKAKIPLSDGIAELVVTVVFSVLAILFCKSALPLGFMISNAGIRVYSVFSDAFLAACVPAIAVMAFFGILKAAVKIKDRGWTPPVCAATVTHQLASMGISIYLIARTNLFSEEFLTLMETIDLGPLNSIPWIGPNGWHPVLIVLVVLTVIGCVAESVKAVYRTVKYRK
jgi:hypothetical protein